MSTHDNEIHDQKTFGAGQEESFGVGYKRPPRSGRFTKGHSGNPAGRSKGRRNLPALLKGLLNASVTVRSGEKTRQMSKAEAMLRVHVGKARQGDGRALDTIVGILDLAGQFDELSDEERNKYGVIQVPAKLPVDEWELLFGPDFEQQRQKYLAMPDIVDPNYMPTAAELKYDAFAKQLNVGDELRTKSDFDAALTAYNEGLNIIRELNAAEPESTRWWHCQAYGVHRVGDVLQKLGHLTDAVLAFREGLDLLRRICVARPDILMAQTDTASFLCTLADAGDNPVSRLSEALKILNALHDRRQLDSQRIEWIGKIEKELNSMAMPGDLRQSNKAQTKVTRPVLAKDRTDKAGGSINGTIGGPSQKPASARDSAVVSEMQKTIEQWKKGDGKTQAHSAEILIPAPEPSPKAVHRKVGYNMDD